MISILHPFAGITQIRFKGLLRSCRVSAVMWRPLDGIQTKKLVGDCQFYLLLPVLLGVAVYSFIGDVCYGFRSARGVLLLGLRVYPLNLIQFILAKGCLSQVKFQSVYTYLRLFFEVSNAKFYPS